MSGPAAENPSGPPVPSGDPRPPGHPVGSRTYARITFALFLAGLATFALLYAPQPLLPLLAAEVGISPGSSAWAISAATIGVGVGLLIAGPVSELVGRTPLMHASLFASSVMGLACGFVDNWPLFLALRAVQGVALAGLPAVAMAYLTEEIDARDGARAAGLYIAGTAMGGMVGRLAAAGLSEVFGAHGALLGIAALGLTCAVAVRLLLPASRRFRPVASGSLRPRELARSTAALLRDPAMIALFGIAASAMGAFVGIFNALSFRLVGPPYLLPVGVAGLVFVVYAVGSVSSTVAGRAAARFGHRAVEPVCVLVILGGLGLTLATPLAAVLAGATLITGGFFAAHGVASGWVASRASLSTGTPGQASSLYLFAYYLGSTIVGALATLAWARGGWGWVVALTGTLLLGTLGLSLWLRRIPSLAEPPQPDPGIVGY